jgi:tetratricopeptide (TPR) repeat protein
MRATIDWSYSLLTDAEQRLFARLGVFAGGCTIESAEAVCNSTSDLSIDVLEGLTLLVEKSLLRQEGEQESRFQMLETIREYAAERLTEQGDGPAQQEAHGRFYLDLAQKATPELRGADQLSWLDRLDADRDNLRAAIGWFRERKDERFLSFAMAMWRYWYTRGFFTEARGWLEAGISSWKEGPHDDQALLASALNAAGILAYALEDYKEARERYEEGLQLCREQGNQGGVAFALNNLGMVAQAEGRYEDARTLQEESLRQMRPLGDKEAIAGLLFHLGSLAQRQGRYGDARGIHEESLTLYRELGDTYGSAMSLNGLGEVAQQQKRYGDAQELYEESLRLKRELGDTFGIAVSLTGLGTLASAQDEHERATTLLAAASVQLASIGIALPPDHREWMEQALALARGTLSEPVYRAAWERGQATDAQGATNHAVE